ncbi:MAG: hypothetical protein J7623_30770 [Chitinophaga sp.]|uniref:hypothetical protein n=1 Tax=Chitinophaga sp. TaxID=1869181 RepID=UPI001B038490|nr:hypothetical protein [Chitinophaga sp.]MBO9733064.1 hypothetical protein [Chitinophaga sp.]
MKKIYLILFLAIMSGGLFAQSTTNTTSTQKSKKSDKEQRKLKKISVFREQEEGENVFQRDFSVGGRLNTDGWTGFVEMGYRKSRKKVTYFQFDFSEKKSNKEVKKSSIYFTQRPYIYGKQNNFYQAKLGVGQRYMLGGKANKNGVEVDLIYYGGLSVGLLKPYYLNMQINGDNKDVKYDPADPEQFLTAENINGAGGFGKGWDNLTVVPGVHAKLGMRFDWAHFNEVVSALEVGMNAEMYTKKIPIMVVYNGIDYNKQFFFGGYVSLQFGKRWNKR